MLYVWEGRSIVSKGRKIEREAAVAVADAFIQDIRSPETRWYKCGSIRRQLDEVGDVDLLCVTDDPAAAIAPPTAAPANAGTVTKWYDFMGVRFNVFVVPMESEGAGLLFATGSGEFNVWMRSLAKRKGYKLNRYGLYDRDTGEMVAGQTEGAIFIHLGLPYIPPVGRRGRPSRPKVLGRYRSSSGPRVYKVQLVDGQVMCDCPGFTYHGHCWHTTKYIEEAS